MPANAYIEITSIPLRLGDLFTVELINLYIQDKLRRPGEQEHTAA